VDIENGVYELRASGRVLKSPGFLVLYSETAEDDTTENEPADVLPALVVGETLSLERLDRLQKFTQPPAQYSEATLVKALEENGIGRPSTYAQILSTLTERDYAAKVDKRFRPTPLGKLVNELLQKGFDDIINEGYTAALETQLDRIEEGDLNWREALGEFDAKFTKDLETAGQEMPNVKRQGLPTDETCPECGAKLVIRFGRYGAFLSCSNYPECKFTRDHDQATGNEGADGEEIAPCEKCGSPMALKRSRYGTFYGCSAYPECKNIRKTGPQAAPPKPTDVPCPECGKGMIVEKVSRRGKVFFSCDRYPECKFALWNRPIDRPCPQCDKPYLVEKTTKRKGTQILCEDKECGYEELAESEALAAR
jgi:DNA topoisomerase-1